MEDIRWENDNLHVKEGTCSSLGAIYTFVKDSRLYEDPGFYYYGWMEQNYGGWTTDKEGKYFKRYCEIIDVYFEEDTIWMTQKSMTQLYQVAKSSISEHIKNIYQDGELIRTIDLQQTSPLTFTIWGENDAFNIIEVTDGSIAVTNASCPDLICVHQGAINSDLIPITCLPNHLVISVSHTTDTDITAY